MLIRFEGTRNEKTLPYSLVLLKLNELVKMLKDEIKDTSILSSSTQTIKRIREYIKDRIYLPYSLVLLKLKYT